MGMASISESVLCGCVSCASNGLVSLPAHMLASTRYFRQSTRRVLPASS